MLLNFYIVSVIICFLVTTLTAISFSKRAEREGYKSKKTQTSFIEKLNSNLQILLKMSIPLFNIIITLVVLFKSDEMYKKIKEDGIKSGDLVPIDEEETKLNNGDNNLSNNKSYFKPTDEEITTKEKIETLEKEKERLIEYQNSFNKNSENKVLKYNMKNNNQNEK